MKTRYPEIDIVHVQATCVGDGLRNPYKTNHWRYVVDGRHVGPIMGTRTEALTYLDTYAHEYGIAQ